MLLLAGDKTLFPVVHSPYAPAFNKSRTKSYLQVETHLAKFFFEQFEKRELQRITLQFLWGFSNERNKAKMHL